MRESRRGRQNVQNVRRYRDVSDKALLLAMQRDDRWAWAEYFARFYPPLEDFARRIRIPSAEWNDCVMDVLEDAAVRFTRESAELPTSLLGYLVVAVRHRFLNLVREERRRTERHADATSELDSTKERIVRSASSQASVRATGSFDAEPDALGRGLRRLSLSLAADLTGEERELLTYLGERVPLARIAEWLNLSYEAARKRSARLRARLRATALVRIESFPAEEQVELRRFFARVRRDTAGGDAA